MDWGGVVAVAVALAWGLSVYFVVRRIDDRLASLVVLFKSHRHNCEGCDDACGSVIFDLSAVDSLPDRILPSPPGNLVTPGAR
jgi:hypothetical protein